MIIGTPGENMQAEEPTQRDDPALIEALISSYSILSQGCCPETPRQTERDDAGRTAMIGWQPGDPIHEWEDATIYISDMFSIKDDSHNEYAAARWSPTTDWRLP